MRLEVEITRKNDELFQRWISDPSTRSFLSDLRCRTGGFAFSSDQIRKANIDVGTKTCANSTTICEFTVTSSSGGNNFRHHSPPLPNSAAGAAASIIHQPSIVAAAASSSAKLPAVSAHRGVHQQDEQKQEQKAASPTAENGEQRHRVDVLNEIEKALQGLPGICDDVEPTSTSPSTPRSSSASSGKPKISSTAQAFPASNNNNNFSLRSLLNRKASQNETVESMINKTADVFRTLPNGKAELTYFGPVCRASGLPGCLRKALFNACCSGHKKKTFVVQYDLTRFWTSIGEDATDEATVLVRLLSGAHSNGRRFLVHDDFVDLIQVIIDEHPGLAFLREAPEFHSRYVQTVIARIFFVVNRSWSGRITPAEIRRSNFIETLHRLDEEEDINRIIDYFSYEHFYVIYCKFWELDRDHDLYINKDDLAHFEDYAISKLAIDRIFSSALCNDRRDLENHRMSYPQFVKFILAEKDKRHPTSVEYWFRCMDMDGDGIISIYELQYFYEEQQNKMIQCGIEPMPFVDILCQILDIVRPETPGKITLSDLKRCKMTPVFFDTFLNLQKYLEHEQAESGAGGLAAALRNGGVDETDTLINEWNLYAAEEYEALVAEEADLGTELKCDDSEEEEK